MSNYNQFELFSLKETASQLHVSVSTLRRLIKDNKIKTIKVEGGIRISKEEIANFLSPSEEIRKEKTDYEPARRVEYYSNLKKDVKTHYIIPGINSIEAETLETIISENVSKEEIINFLKEEKYDKLFIF